MIGMSCFLYGHSNHKHFKINKNIFNDDIFYDKEIRLMLNIKIEAGDLLSWL